MAAELQFLQSAEKLKRLHDTEVLLHLFQHRNKNQHRRSIWWRQFSIFRRQLKHLLHDIAGLTPTADTHVERAKVEAARPRIEERLVERIQFWNDVCAATWFQAFTQLSADSRFAALGLTLITVLAEVCTIVGVTMILEQQAESEVRQMLDHFGRETWSKEANNVQTNEQSVVNIDMEDAGTSIAREPLTKDDVLKTADHLMYEKNIEPEKPASKIMHRKKRVKKKGNAIDDLFGDL